MIVRNKEVGHYLDDESFESFSKNIKQRKLKFHQFYNNEIYNNEFGFIQYMKKYKDNNNTKLLNKTYYDIETFVDEDGAFTDPVNVIEPINAVALYNNIKNTAVIIGYVEGKEENGKSFKCNITDPKVIEEGVHKLYKDACKRKPDYIIEDLKIEVIIVKDEKELLTVMFNKLKEFNQLLLIGFNSSQFDDAYIFNRSEKLFGEVQRNNLASEFGIVKKYNDKTFELPDYELADILQLYKPVGQGGGGLGKALPDYKLNTVCKKVLGLTKLDLDLGFRQGFLQDIVGYLTYNLLDTLLTFKLDDRLKFLEQSYELAKYNNATMGATLRGRSFLYSYRNDLMYLKENKVIRTKKFSKEVLYEPKIREFD